MESNLIDYSEWKRKCRLCLQKQGDAILYRIFDVDGGQIIHKLKSCCNLLIYERDPLPQMICHKCIYNLDSAYKFQMKCLNSYNILVEDLKSYSHVHNFGAYLQTKNQDRNEQVEQQIKVKEEKPVTVNLIPMAVECIYPSAVHDKSLKITEEVDLADTDSSDSEQFAASSSSETRYAKCDEDSTKKNVTLQQSTINFKTPKNSLNQNIIAKVSLISNVTNNKILVRCDICNKCFDSLRALSKHRLIHRDRNSCTSDFQTNDISSLSSHEETHSGISQSATHNEDHRSNVSNLSERNITHHKITHFCGKCNKTYAKEREFMLHLCNDKNGFRSISAVKKKVHESKGKNRDLNNTHTCNICRRVCSSLERYVKHYKMHTMSRLSKYRCEDCHSAFITQTSLKKHSCENLQKKPVTAKRSVRANLKPYACNLCNETFCQSKNYLNHQKKHLKHDSLARETIKKNDTLFKCSICLRSFLRKTALIQHKKTHAKDNRETKTESHTGNVKASGILSSTKTDKDDLNCKICKKNFPNKFIFEKHEIRCKSYSCKNCEKKFRNYKGFKYHMSRKSCKIKSKQQKTSASENRVKQKVCKTKSLPAFNCSVCKKVFSKYQQLVVHKKSHSNVTSVHYKAKRRLNSITDTHIKIQPLLTDARKGVFGCDICNEDFTTKVKLERHKLLHRRVTRSNKPVLTPAKKNTGTDMVENNRVTCLKCHKDYSKFSIHRHIKRHEMEGY